LVVDTDDEEDIGSEWSTLKNVPKAKAKSPEVENLRLDILDARQPHPEFIYRVHEGYGLDSMALWRSRCHAKRHLKEGLHKSNVKDVFIYSMDKLLIAGPKYTESPEHEGRQYTSACKAFQITIEAAIEEWETVKQKHITTNMQQINHLRGEAAKFTQYAKTLEQANLRALKTRLQAEDLT
jgi:hypothetical protein